MTILGSRFKGSGFTGSKVQGSKKGGKARKLSDWEAGRLESANACRLSGLPAFKR